MIMDFMMILVFEKGPCYDAGFRLVLDVGDVLERRYDDIPTIRTCVCIGDAFFPNILELRGPRNHLKCNWRVRGSRAYLQSLRMIALE